VSRSARGPGRRPQAPAETYRRARGKPLRATPFAPSPARQTHPKPQQQRRNSYSYPQSASTMPASIPGSKFNRQGGSKFNRRRHAYLACPGPCPDREPHQQPPAMLHGEHQAFQAREFHLSIRFPCPRRATQLGLVDRCVSGPMRPPIMRGPWTQFRFFDLGPPRKVTTAIGESECHSARSCGKLPARSVSAAPQLLRPRSCRRSQRGP
jgi:hypothetical protein